MYRLLCQNCVWTVHPVMLTTYSIRGCRCDRCQRLADLAIVKEAPDAR